MKAYRAAVVILSGIATMVALGTTSAAWTLDVALEYGLYDRIVGSALGLIALLCLLTLCLKPSLWAIAPLAVGGGLAGMGTLARFEAGAPDVAMDFTPVIFPPVVLLLLGISFVHLLAVAMDDKDEDPGSDS